MSRLPPGAERFTPPAGALAYRRIGPFDKETLPAGLLREHRLKGGTWGRVEVKSGTIGFVWDDGEGEGPINTLEAGQAIHIPPEIPHHLVHSGEDFVLEIEFLAEAQEKPASA